MRYVLEIAEMTLLDLLDVRSQALVGLLHMDEENFSSLIDYIKLRAEVVQRLEKNLG